MVTPNPSMRTMKMASAEPPIESATKKALVASRTHTARAEPITGANETVCILTIPLSVNQ